MKLATTTADMRGYANSIAGEVKLFVGTGFRLLDLNLYKVIYPGSPFIEPGDGWKKDIYEAGKAAVLGMSFCQAHAPEGEHFITGEKRDNLITATKRSIEACAILGIPNIVVHSAPSPTLILSQFMYVNRDFHALFYDDMDRVTVNTLIENGCE